jgi:hypothetical protein
MLHDGGLWIFETFRFNTASLYSARFKRSMGWDGNKPNALLIQHEVLWYVAGKNQCIGNM